MKERLSLDPLEKYVMYDRPPYKLTLHIILAILMSLSFMMQVVPNNMLARSQQIMWYKKFLLNGEDEEIPIADDFDDVKLVFTTKELVDIMDRSIANYYGMFNNPN